MPPPLSRLVNHLRRTALEGVGDPVGDDQLLQRFVAERDLLAFELLLRRHGPMVLSVCQRVIGNSHDAEDAFQATFLVLVRRAARIRPPHAVGSWLHGVAYRTALGARSRLARRRSREVLMPNLPACLARADASWDDLRLVLDRELSVLPEKYRLPIVLSDLEGRSRKEVARALAIPEGTLSSRLATARKLLAARLTRRGVTLSGGALAVIFTESASAAVPSALWLSTTQAALVFAAGPAAAAGIVSGPVPALTEGMIRMMFLAKLKMTAAVLVGVTALCLGAGGILYQARAGIGEPREGQSPSPQLAHQEPAPKLGQAQLPKHDDAQRKRLAELRRALEDARAEALAAQQQALEAQAMQIRAEARVRLAQANLQKAQDDVEGVRFLTPGSGTKRRVGQQAGVTRSPFPIPVERRLQELEERLRQRDAQIEQLRLQLNALLASQAKGPAPLPASRGTSPEGERTFMFACKYVPAGDAAALLRRLFSRKGSLRIGFDEPTNQLIVNGPPESHKMVKDLLGWIDVPGRKAPAVSGDKLDRILERLDHIERRLDRLEPHQTRPAR